MKRQVIIPGEKVPEKTDAYTYTDGGETYSMVFGLLDQYDDNFSKIVPLTGKYMAKIGDYVVGVVADVKFGGCTVDINSPYTAFLPTRRDYEMGDIVFAKVSEINEVKSVVINDERKLTGGDLIEISPVKIPRVIGKKNSMLQMIRDKTKTDLFVGRNGRIWLKGGDIAKAEKAVQKIEKEAHTHGLTERIKEFLESGAAS